MNLKEILVEALQAVDEAEIPGDLRSIAFSKAIDLAATAYERQPAETAKKATNHKAQSEEPDVTSGASLDRIARKLKVDRTVAGHVYNLGADGKLELVISQGRLPDKYGPATREIALLIAAGRQAAGIDADWTSTDEIRGAAEHYRRLDSANFAAHINGMEQEFLFRGTPRKREVKLSVPGWESAQELVNRLGKIG